MKSRCTRVAAACAVSVVLFAACNSEADPTSSTTGDTTVAATDTTTPAGTAATDSVVPAEGLESLLIESVPADYLQVDDSDADTGPSDLAKAIRDDGGDDAEAVLTDAGFLSGYQRAWQTQDQTGMIILYVYEFSEPDGAATYAQRTISIFDTDTSLSAVPFDVDGIPSSFGRSLTSLEADGRLAASVVFAKAGYLVQIVVLGPTDTENQVLARQLALDQFDRL